MNSRNTRPNNRARRAALSLSDLLRRDIRWYLLLGVMLLGILMYFWFEWRSLAHFVAAMDTGSKFMEDFRVVYYRMGRHIHRSPTPVPSYIYTAFFALLMAPIGALRLVPAMVVWGMIQFVCVVLLCVVPARGPLKLRPLESVLFVGLCLTSFPILHNIKWGQVSTLITACVLVAFASSSRNRRTIAGVLLAFAAALKLYPAIFIVYYILRRDIRTCVTFGLAAFVFYFAFPASVLGFSNWFEFEKTTMTVLKSFAGVNSQDVTSQYLVHVVLRLLDVFGAGAAGDVLVQLLTILGYVIALSCFAMVWTLQRRPSCEEHGLALAPIFLSIPFIVSSSWPHYFSYLPFCQTAVLSYCALSFRTSGLGRKAIIGLPILSMVLSSVFLFNLFPDWRVYNSYGMLFLSNALLLIAVMAISIVCPNECSATQAKTESAQATGRP